MTQWVDDDFPGFVEIQFQQADDATVALIEKAPVLDNEDRLTLTSAYPVPWRLGCDVLHVEHDQHGRHVATIELHAGVSDPSGNGVYEVSVDQLGDMPAT
ncbi:hypothetical protein [Nocardia sp. XZ_19_385]|uniref:hypothetical protein n=1 Tax=Nocardia sp. XZ_19_385 TaxID=2769488 RepID=UPI0018907723|nr:hypothetical protein [Nocardia sp. XZ_19_385]